MTIIELPESKKEKEDDDSKLSKKVLHHAIFTSVIWSIMIILMPTLDKF